jgi:antitoxin PrlF
MGAGDGSGPQQQHHRNAQAGPQGRRGEDRDEPQLRHQHADDEQRVRYGDVVERGVAGAPVQGSFNAVGELVFHPPKPGTGAHTAEHDRFDAVRGRADVPWRTDALMKLLRADD